jgi:hypothetical protein
MSVKENKYKQKRRGYDLPPANECCHGNTEAQKKKRQDFRASVAIWLYQRS